MNALISIIMPVYNTKAYLEESVRSVQAQTYGNWELLIVDDGSKDGSGELCDELAAADPRIRVCHQENGGVSTARNRALDEAKGDYICFLDSDDGLDPAYLAWFIEKKEESGAVFVACAQAENREGSFAYPALQAEKALMEADDYVSQALADQLKVPLACWNWLLPAERVGDKRFAKGVAFGEDTLFLLSILAEGGKVYYEPKPHYIYRMDRAGSTMANRSLDKAAKTVAVWQRILALYPEESRNHALIRKILLGYCCEALRRALKEKNVEGVHHYKKKARRQWRRMSGSSFISLKDKIRLLFYWLMPRLSEKVMLKIYGRV